MSAVIIGLSIVVLMICGGAFFAIRKYFDEVKEKNKKAQEEVEAEFRKGNILIMSDENDMQDMGRIREELGELMPTSNKR